MNSKLLGNLNKERKPQRLVLVVVPWLTLGALLTGPGEGLGSSRVSRTSLSFSSGQNRRARLGVALGQLPSSAHLLGTPSPPPPQRRGVPRRPWALVSLSCCHKMGPADHRGRAVRSTDGYKVGGVCTTAQPARPDSPLLGLHVHHQGDVALDEGKGEEADVAAVLPSSHGILHSGGWGRGAGEGWRGPRRTRTPTRPARRPRHTGLGSPGKQGQVLALTLPSWVTLNLWPPPAVPPL